MKKVLGTLLVAGLVIVVLLATVWEDNVRRLRFVTSLFSGAEQYENFASIAEFLPTSTMTASPNPYLFETVGTAPPLPAVFLFDGRQVPTKQFLEETDTSALLVLYNGKLLREDYWLSGGKTVNWLSMSVAKSFVATAIGIAVDEGKIDIQQPITQYVQALKGSAYDGVRIKDVLQMSSGAAWNEDYGDINSDVNRMGRSMTFGSPLSDFVAEIQPENAPGTLNRYNSGDTQALGMLLRAATGTTITAYMQEKLWHPLGMESNGYWIVDDEKMELAFAGLNATARDYAKIGELYRMKGRWRGAQLVSKQWIKDSTTADAPHLLPGLNADFPLGYGYQWWLPESTEGEFAAIGVYNQFVYVNPSRNLVIVKLSANSNYAVSEEQSAYREMETFEFFRAIGASVVPASTTAGSLSGVSPVMP